MAVLTCRMSFATPAPSPTASSSSPFASFLASPPSRLASILAFDALRDTLTSSLSVRLRLLARVERDQATDLLSPSLAPPARLAAFLTGHVDSGKSTTTGHLIYKCGGIDKRTIEKLCVRAPSRS